ncbi:transglycosylase family protein [Pseudonocardia sp. RS010]|uniref:transglycosylase family protein n=1 Tax=Pseudonocardia sp. RS010 TaxID=3385979 RepID=UPI00399FDCA8
MAVNAADSGNGTSGNNVQCSITSNNNSSTDAATKTGDVFGTAQVQPTTEQLQRAAEILDQARALLGELPLTGGDGTATALQARLQARGITPALGTGVAQAARDASDALLAVPGTRPASIATALARAGYGPTPADVVPRVVTPVAVPGQPTPPTVSAVYTPDVAPGAGPVSALANLVDQQPAIQRQMLTAADSHGSQADCLAWLSKVQKLVEQALADPNDPATARVLQELQNSDGADLLRQGNGQQSGGTTSTPSSGSGDGTSSPRGEGAGTSGGPDTAGGGGSGSTGSGSTSQGTGDNAGNGSTGDRSTDGAEGDWQSATQDLLSKLDAAAPDDPTAGEWANDIRGVIGQEGQSANEASGSGQGSSSESSSSGDSSSGDASWGNGQGSDDNDQGEQDSSRGDQGSSDKPEQPAATPPAAAAAPTASNSWEPLANCESSGKWDTNTGNGYYGGLQFDNATWSAYGGTKFAPSADKATKEQQIEIAEKVRQDRGGFGAWPACSSKLGLSK